MAVTETFLFLSHTGRKYTLVSFVFPV